MIAVLMMMCNSAMLRSAAARGVAHAGQHESQGEVASDAFVDLGFARCCFSHSLDCWDEHLLLLLHGIGDTDANFSAFGAELQLPQTAVLAIRAPIPLLDMGFTWFDVLTPAGDVCFDSPDAIASLWETSAAMLPLLQRVQQRCVCRTFPPHRIFVTTSAGTATRCATSSCWGSLKAVPSRSALCSH
jgi:hypothetical protein